MFSLRAGIAEYVSKGNLLPICLIFLKICKISVAQATLFLRRIHVN